MAVNKGEIGIYGVLRRDGGDNILARTDQIQDAKANKTQEQLNLEALNKAAIAAAHIANIENPHSVNKSQVGLGNVSNDALVKRSEMGKPLGVATLDEQGKVPSSQLPSFVDDVQEFHGLVENVTLTDTPPVVLSVIIGIYYDVSRKVFITKVRNGETEVYTSKMFPSFVDKPTSPTPLSGKIYVDLSTNKTYRWSGSNLVEISASLALGETENTAFAGDRGVALEGEVAGLKESVKTKADKDFVGNNLNSITRDISNIKTSAIKNIRPSYDATHVNLSQEKIEGAAVNISIDTATSSKAGAMSAADKEKLDNFIDSEGTRNRNETARVSAETGRAAAETARAKAETARADAETKRAAAETKRETDFSAKVEEVNTAVTNANTATAGAEKVDATITEANVFEVTGRDGVKKSLGLVGQAEAATIKAELVGKADKVVRFDNAEKQYETDNKDVEIANSHILELYTDLVLAENERLILSYLAYQPANKNYYAIFEKYNSETKEVTYLTKTEQLDSINDGSITHYQTLDGKNNIYMLFVSNGDKTINIHSIGQGEARMPYATENAFSFNENKTILSSLNTKIDIVQELGDSEDKVMSQKAVKNVVNVLQNSINSKSDKIIRFDNINQEQSDIVDTEEANRDFLEIYTDLVLSENERVVLTYLSYISGNYYVIFGKFNSSTNEESLLTEQVSIESGKVTEINTTEGKKIYVLFDISKYKNEIRNIGQGYKRMPYLNEKAYSLIYNDNIRNYINSSNVKEIQKVITIWGDSITWGSNASEPSKCYAMILQSLLTNNGVSAKVINCGIGGENFQNILVRQGAFGFYLSEDITLPHNKSEIVIQTVTNYILDRKFKNTWYGDDSYFGLLIQGENGRGSEAEEYKTVNPIYANGHKCKMSYNGDLQNANITLCLDEDVTNDVIIKKGTPLYCHGNSFKSDISVFSIGTNDGWTIKSNDVFDAEKSAENYINMIDLAIGKAGTSKVIICSPYGGSALNIAGVEGLKVLESALAKHFGSRFFNWREYLVNYGLSDAGLSATEQDLKDINEGKCPSSLLSDVVHPNDKGHEILGKKLYEIMKLNGFILNYKSLTLEI